MYKEAIRIKIDKVIFRARKKSNIPAGKGIIIRPNIKIRPNANIISVFLPSDFNLYY